MASKTESFYIRILKYAYEHEDFTLNEMVEELNLTLEQKTRLIKQIHEGSLFTHPWTSFSVSDGADKNYKLNISIEDHFRLIEYIELQEARKASRKATYFASAALLLSAITALAPYLNKINMNSIIHTLFKVLGIG